MTVTSILLNDQSKAESLKERNVKQFEKKQETYHLFMGEFSDIIIKLTQRSLSRNDCEAYENIASLEKLIFQFGYLRIHMSEDKFNQIMSKTTEMLNVYYKNGLAEIFKEDIVDNKFSRSETLNHALHELMLSIANNLFEISTILNKDMYPESVGKGLNKQSENVIIEFLNSTGLRPKGMSLPPKKVETAPSSSTAASDAESAKALAKKRRKRKNK